MVKFLLNLGADPNVINKHRINMLHVAAQGDQPASLAFFKKMNLDVNAKDAKESTPLHWACYAG